MTTTDLLNDLEKMGIFADVNPADPASVRQLMENMITDGEFILRRDESGTIVGKFFFESVHFFIRPGVLRLDPERGLYRVTE